MLLQFLGIGQVSLRPQLCPQIQRRAVTPASTPPYAHAPSLHAARLLLLAHHSSVTALRWYAPPPPSASTRKAARTDPAPQYRNSPPPPQSSRQPNHRPAASSHPSSSQQRTPAGHRPPVGSATPARLSPTQCAGLWLQIPCRADLASANTQQPEKDLSLIHI